MSDHDEKNSSRRDAIKRLGLLAVGAGAAFAPTGVHARMVPLSCYNSCAGSYNSIDHYTSNGGAMSIYSSFNEYTSSCYTSCESYNSCSYNSESVYYTGEGGSHYTSVNYSSCYTSGG